MTWGTDSHRQENAHRSKGSNWKRRNQGAIQAGKKAVSTAKSEKGKKTA